MYLINDYYIAHVQSILCNYLYFFAFIVGEGRRIRRQTPEIVAFHATINPDTDWTGAVGNALVFPDVTINIGNAYHESAGLFIAPTKGLYLFSFSALHAHYGGILHLGLMKNSFTLAKVFTKYGSGGHGQGSSTAVVQLEVGDEVFIKILYSEAAPDVHANKMSSFMGYLLVYL